MLYPALFAPLKAVEVRSSVVLLPCVLGSMAYLPQYSHREPSIKLGFWKGSRESLDEMTQLIKSENHFAACAPLEFQQDVDKGKNSSRKCRWKSHGRSLILIVPCISRLQLFSLIEASNGTFYF